MKKNLSCILFFTVFIITSQAQEVQFPPSVLSAGGGVISTNTSHISKWRIGRVNVLYIDSDDLKSSTLNESFGTEQITERQITAYPNPVHDFLNVQFELEEQKQVFINVANLNGSKVVLTQKHHIEPKQTININLSGLAPALYLINVYTEDRTLNEIFKITKSE